MSGNTQKARITRISKVKADRGLEVSKSTIFSIQAAIENNEKAFADTVSQLESRFAVSNNGTYSLME